MILLVILHCLFFNIIRTCMFLSLSLSIYNMQCQCTLGIRLMICRRCSHSMACTFDVKTRAKCKLVPPIDLQVIRKSTCKMYVGTPLGPINLQIMCKTTCRIHVGTPPSPPAYKLGGKTRAEFMLVPPGPTYST